MHSGRLKPAVRDLAVLAFCTSLMFALKMAMVWLPNIHMGALLIIVYTQKFRQRVLYIIYAYVLLEIAVFGFNPLWSIGYLYVWIILAGLTWLLRNMKSALGWATLSGAFGLAFGALTAPPFLLITLGPERFFQAFLPYWAAGIPFDIVHCAGNFAICLFLYKPVTKALEYT